MNIKIFCRSLFPSWSG